MIGELILNLVKKVTVNLVLNLSLLFVFAFFNIIIEEDNIIGCFSTLILFILFVFLKELKSETTRQLRLRTKLVFRIQKLVLKHYSFFYSIISKIHLKFMKKLTFKIIFLKFTKLDFKSKTKTIFAKTRLIFVKIYSFNLLVLLVLLFPINFYKYS